MQLRRGFDEVLDAIIQEHRDLAAGKLPGGKPNDFISILLDLPGERGAANLDDKTIKALILVSTLGPSQVIWAAHGCQEVYRFRFFVN